jgi:histidyl-tRNA synthetase
MLASRIFNSFGINDFKLIINSLGNSESRTKYRQALIDYLKYNEQKLSKDSQIRLQINPLRILDSKVENDIEILNNAPKILDFLDLESKEHFEQVLSILDFQNKI